MPQVEAIQILLKIKTLGDDVISKTIGQISNLGKTLANVGLTDVIQKNASTAIQKIQEVSTIAQIKSIEASKAVTGQTKKDVSELETYITQFGKAASTVLGMFSAWSVFNDSLPAIKQVYDISNGIVPNAEKIITLFREGKTISAMVTGVASVATTLAKATSFIPALFLSKYIAFSAFEAVRGLLGLAPKGLSFLEKANRLVTSIDAGLNKTFVTAGSFIQPLTVGLSTITGLVTGLISTTTGFIGGFAFLSGIGNILASYGAKVKLRISAAFGNGQSRLILLFTEFRDLAYNLLDTLRSKANSILVLGSKFKDSFTIDPSNAKKFTSEINSLSAIRFPMEQQFQLFIAEVRPFLNYVIKQISVITMTLFQGFGLSKEKIEEINKNAETTLTDVQNKSKQSFGFVHNELKKAFDISAFGRWWQTSKLALVFRIPFDLLITKPLELSLSLSTGLLKGFWNVTKATFSGIGSLVSGAFSLAFSGIKSIFGKTKKELPQQEGTKPKTAVGVEPKIDEKKPIEGLKLVRQFGEETYKIFAKAVQILWGSLDQLVAKTVMAKEKIKQAIGDNNEQKKYGNQYLRISAESSANMKPVAQALKGVIPATIDAAGKDYLLIYGQIRTLANVLVAVSKGEKIVGDNFKSIQAGMTAIASILPAGSSVAEDILKRISNPENEKKLEGKIASNPPGQAILKKLVVETDKAIADLRNNKRIDSGGFAEIFANIILGDLEGPDFRIAKNRILKLIGSLTEIEFPKTGYQTKGLGIVNELVQGIESANPLFKKGGAGVIKETAKGIADATPQLKKAMDKATEAADKLLPHSPAEEGAFKTLRQAGAKIIDELTLGIASKVPFLVNVFFKLAKFSVDAMKPMIEVGHMAERTGVAVETFSSLQHAFAGFEVSASDLQMTFTSLGKSINEVATTEKQSALANIGVSLAKARKSAAPTTDLFLQLSDAMKKFPIHSPQMQKALEAIGLSTQSNIVNAMAMGREEILKMMEEGAAVGATFDQSFVEVGHSFSTTVNKIGKIGEYLERDFLQAMIGPLKIAAEMFWKFYSENAVSIRSIIKIAGEVFSVLLDMIGQFFQKAMKNPAGALEFLGRNIQTLWNGLIAFAAAALNDFAYGVLAKIGGWAGAGAGIVWEIIKEYVAQFSDLIWNKVASWMQMLKVKFYEFIDAVVNNEHVKSFLKLIGLSGQAENLKAKLQAEQQILTQFEKEQVGDSFSERIIKVAYKTQKFIAQAKKEMETNAIALGDSKEWDESKARFSAVLTSMKKEFMGVAQETGFGDIFAEGFKKIDALISKQRWDEVANEMQALSDKAKGVVDKVGDIGKEAEKTAQKTITAIADVGQSIKEAAQNEAKIKTLTLQAKLQATRSASEREKIQRDIDLQSFITSQQEELKQFKEALDAKFAAEENDKEKIKMLEEFQATQKQSLDQKTTDAETQEATAKYTKILNVVGNFADGFQTLFANMYELTGRKIKAFFYMEKAAAIAQAIVNTALAAIRAFAEGGPFFGPALAAMATAVGTTQVGIITKTMIDGPQEYAKGGSVPGSGDKDSVPAMLTPGEVVIQKGAVRKYGAAFLNALNEGMLPERMIDSLSGFLPSPVYRPQVAFASGGFVMPIANSQQTKQEVNIINVTSPSEIEKFLYSSAGKKTIVNILAAENNKVRKIVNNT